MIWQLTTPTSWSSGDYVIRRNIRGGFAVSYRYKALEKGIECASSTEAKELAQAHAIKQAAQALHEYP